MVQGVSPLEGGLMLFMFGLGHAIPLIPLSFVSGRVRNSLAEKYMSVGKVVSSVAGAIVVAMGLLFMLRFFGVELW